MDNNVAIIELNALLKGQYMGIHQYENYIQHTSDQQLKKQLQRIQQDHKRHALVIAERIQNLGGTPVDSTGFVGNMQEMMSKMKGLPDQNSELIQELLVAEDKYAVELSEEIVKGDLDPESKKIVEQVIDEDRGHVQELKNLLIH
ncbi:MAG: ferritin-like domain-containing protein [Bacillota bacterium]|nr:ferritin-like domain-containing protein [Bacillota bacterium]